MPHGEVKRMLTIISACMTARGTPTFAINEVEVTQEQAENGLHYYFVEAELLEAGYEEPFVHFTEEEAPAFLLPAVRLHLSHQPTVPDPISTLVEDR